MSKRESNAAVEENVWLKQSTKNIQSIFSFTCFLYLLSRLESMETGNEALLLQRWSINSSRPCCSTHNRLTAAQHIFLWSKFSSRSVCTWACCQSQPSWNKTRNYCANVWIGHTGEPRCAAGGRTLKTLKMSKVKTITGKSHRIPAWVSHLQLWQMCTKKKVIDLLEKYCFQLCVHFVWISLCARGGFLWQIRDT